ncbi:MAG: hypothetical protein NT138_17590 [Planctomycetales bacterium]|nr:hypothetical protein [Planctomycetales bacterium]
MTGHQTEPIAADPANRACRAGHSNYVRAASERIFIERRDAAPRSTNVAVSLRRDEPCSTPLRPNRETVYNIEVDGEHVFYVGEDGVLVHNTCDWRMWEKQAGKHFKRKGFDVVGSIRNASGHGIDMVLRNRKTGQIFIAEVKARTRSWGALSKLQRQGSAANAGRILKELFDARQSGRGHWAPHNLSPGTTVVESVLREAITDGNFGGGFIVRINEGLRGISETPWP